MFEIDPKDCELIFLFNQYGSIKEVAQKIQRDPSVVLRQLQRIAKQHELLVKINSKWKLTEKGVAISTWYGEALDHQKLCLNSAMVLRIGCPAPFAERVLCENLNHENLKFLTSKYQLQILSPENLEASLLAGQVDIVLTCGVPHDPRVRFKKGPIETWAIVATPKFCKENRLDKRSLEYTMALPYVKHLDVAVEEMLGIDEKNLNIILSSDRLISVRTAILQSMGWGLLPQYSVQQEIDEKKLINLNEMAQKHTRFQKNYNVWWRINNKEHQACALKMAEWLNKQVL